MRPRRSRAAYLLLTSVVLSGLLVPATTTAQADPTAESRGAAPAPAPAPAPEPPRFGAECRTTIDGSHVSAFCHNPYPETDLVRLHVECDRWWDIDGDSAPVTVGPAGYAELSDRCWKEVRAVWISHQHPEAPSGT
ncbi:hypothetical protein NLX86_25110 [Streptomyces sp. A3M-1-3]|uniref:hypothetical protein n=1 Tax=Streptomyces sp. A3M-1-3 TaxID=2962044 RepID=UPI0020B7E559|nr:hypothetical protein [Streptomyces sp. A3M-1-3]MCP3821252.1 hypothetical protein [Streptomyces sp. A3M-1-3]